MLFGIYLKLAPSVLSLINKPFAILAYGFTIAPFTAITNVLWRNRALIKQAYNLNKKT
jgi:hypothetical protein